MAMGFNFLRPTGLFHSKATTGGEMGAATSGKSLRFAMRPSGKRCLVSHLEKVLLTLEEGREGCRCAQ